jgi:methionyl-tRNA synthetase
LNLSDKYESGDEMAKYIVTITPPTPNGDLHLGHLAGPFLAADICARMLRQQKHDVILLSYSDDYQSYLLRKARQTDQEPMQIAAANADAMAASLASVDIDLAYFLKAFGNRYFLEEVNRYFDIVDGKGAIVSSAAQIPYCRECGVFGYEGFARGICNYCGGSSDASQCENCANVPDLAQMTSIRCILCDETMANRTVERLEWQIGASYRQLIERYHGANHRSSLKSFLAMRLQQTDDEWPLTRPGEQAIPLERHPSQPIHTWFAGLAGYRATLREYLASSGGDLNDWWNHDTSLVQFLGFDCAYSHVIAYASQLALEQTGPSKLFHFTNRFLQLDGENFSTSRGHAVWIRDISAKYPVDAVRLYASLYAPEDEVKDFRMADFEKWVGEWYVPKVAHGTWTRIDAGRSVAFAKSSSDLGSGWSALFADWTAATKLENFSIVKLAAIQLRAAALIETAPLAQHDLLWLIYAHLGEAVHPRLSRDIAAALPRRRSEVLELLSKLGADSPPGNKAA